MSESLDRFAERTAELDGLREANMRLAQQLREAKNRQVSLVDAVFSGEDIDARRPGRAYWTAARSGGAGSPAGPGPAYQVA